jgi:transcriptional regulator with XRE-family HTH domain
LRDVVDEVDVDAWLVALGKRVRILRLTREMTQDDLAVAAGMSRSFVSLIEHGTHGIDVVRLLRLAAALEVPLVDLLGPTPPDPRSPG